MKKILTTISLLLFVTIAVALEYKPGKKIPAKEGVVGLNISWEASFKTGAFEGKLPFVFACWAVTVNPIATTQIDSKIFFIVLNS